MGPCNLPGMDKDLQLDVNNLFRHGFLLLFFPFHPLDQFSPCFFHRPLLSPPEYVEV